MKAIDAQTITALEKTAEALHTELKNSQTMPFDIGTLQGDSTFIDTSQSGNGHVAVVSSTPYARRLYYHPEYNFRKDNNASAGGEWFNPFLSGDKKDFAKNAFKKFMGQG